MVAVILGTGTNACYVERTDAIPKMPASNSQSGTTVSQNLFCKGVYKVNMMQSLRLTTIHIISDSQYGMGSILDWTSFD